MSSRMNKYYEEPENLMTRTTRNQDLYKDISKSELENYSIKSNATILGDNKNEIDVEKIKKILDTKYNEVPKRKTIKIEEEEEEIIEKEDTKEYDINQILEKAKEEKIVNYEEERLRKLRDTQFDILNNLELEEDREENEKEKDDLAELINTIAFNEKHNNEEVDLLSALQGEDNTEVFGAMKEEKEPDNIEKQTAKELEESFYTKSNLLDLSLIHI